MSRSVAVVLILAHAACSAYAAPVPAGAPAWTERAPGLDTAELPIVGGGESPTVIDTFALVRIDPHRYALSVHVDTAVPKSVVDWQATLGAAVVINGGYFEPSFVPTAPTRAGGTSFGPARYHSDHGALVIDAASTPDVVDLRGRDVIATLAPYPDAMVSYPLLVDDRGATRAGGHADWYAARQVVGIDDTGRLIIATTRSSSFSLPALGAWLVASHLMRVALNLDGGPSASQLVQVGAFRQLVTPPIARTGGIRLPIVLAAIRR